MYRLGSIARRLVRDDAELGREFGDGHAVDSLNEWLCVISPTLMPTFRMERIAGDDMYDICSGSQLLRSTKTLGVGTR